MWEVLKGWFRKVVAFFRPDNGGAPILTAKTLRYPSGEPFRAGDAPPGSTIEFEVATGEIVGGVPKPPAPPPRPAPPPPPEPLPAARAKWAKPKGVELLTPQRRAAGEAPKPPPRPRAPRPAARIENPEKWGQYYFRDAILDQLEVYFTYLRRMKQRDRSAYELHRRLGIQILPRSTVQNFDDWRYEGTMDELDAWWKEHRPAFGAVSYGIDRDSLEEESIRIVDISPEKLAEINKGRERNRLMKQEALHRTVTITGASDIDYKGEKIENAIMWVPRFLHFSKYDQKHTPPDVQRAVDGDVYSMTVYWDRLDHRSKKWLKTAGKKGGIPQEYAVCVEKETGKVRCLKMLMHDSVRVRHTHGVDRGKLFSIPNTHWAVPTEYLCWATGRTDVSPENYLRRLFIEAALMYESASLGSMIRVEVKKGDLVAVFGVDAKRTAYFFKDRDVTAASLTEGGRRKAVFHSVRPHTRQTKKGEIGIRMQFRGLREFDWAGYKVSITVPGRDHFHIAEFDLGMHHLGKDEPMPKGAIDSAGVAEYLLKYMREGVNKWKATGTRR